MRLSRLSFLFAAVLGMSTSSCRGCSKKGPDLSAPIVEAPVAAPALLLAEMTVENPDAFWGKLQHGMGGLAGLMPASTGGLLAALAALDSAAGPIVDGASPAYAAIVGTTTAKRWAAAVRVTDLPHARQALFDGPAAKYNPVDDGDFVLLAPKAAPTTPAPYTFAISKTGYLVIAPTKENVEEIGPYLVRTMPTHPRATADATLDVPHAALAGPLHDGLMERWVERTKDLAALAKNEADAHGREADFADPAGILAASDQAMQKRLTALADVASIHVDFTANADLLDAEAILTPGDGNGPAAQWLATTSHGDLTPLLEAPQGYGGVLWRTSDADRASFAVDGDQLLRRVFARRLDEAEFATAHQALTDWAAGVGDHTVVTASGAPVFSVRVTTPTTHPVEIAKGTREALELVSKALQSGTFEPLIGKPNVVFGTDDIVGLGKAQTMTVYRADQPNVSAAWLTQAGNFKLVFASDASAALGAPDKAPLWKDDPRVGPRAIALGPNVGLAVVAKPLAADPNAFAFASFGLDGSRGKVTLTLSDVLLREALPMFDE